jgi:hypothetical protein
MRAQQVHIGDGQNPVVHIREQETPNFKALIDEIWRHFTEGAIDMRRRIDAFQIDASTDR